MQIQYAYEARAIVLFAHLTHIKCISYRLLYVLLNLPVSFYVNGNCSEWSFVFLLFFAPFFSATLYFSFLYLFLRFCHATNTKKKKLCECRKKDRKTKYIICKMNKVYSVYFGLPQNTGGYIFVYAIAVNT